jgi:hypothetical protein
MTISRVSTLAWLFVLGASVALAAAAPEYGEIQGRSGPQPAQVSSGSAFGFVVLSTGQGPQWALMPRARRGVASLRPGEEMLLTLPIKNLAGPATFSIQAVGRRGTVEVSLSFDDKGTWRPLGPQPIVLEAAAPAGKEAVARLAVRAGQGTTEGTVEWRTPRLTVAGQAFDVPLTITAGDPTACPPPEMPPLRPDIQQAMIEWDWRMQDGIATERFPSTYAAAVARLLPRVGALLDDVKKSGVGLDEASTQWQRLCKESEELTKRQPAAGDDAWEDLWLGVHRLRRRIALANPLAQTGPVIFAKQAPSMFSHQLTQYQGSVARPGGGLFVLDRPGASMECRQLAAGKLPLGNWQFPEVSYDGKRVLFSHVHAETVPPNREKCLDRFYHLDEMDADGANPRQLTTDSFDDLAPRYLPDGRIVFISTRRGGFHRCGAGPCPTHTLAMCDADGSHPHAISFHETHEWDPVVLNDGRVLYTRWDYVDRNAVHYQQLWTVRGDGTDARAFYGNNTLNPVGVWESRAVPGSNRVMATAAAHHAMTAGSIILLDVTRGIDGSEPITRLTPDALFPESEVPVAQRGPGTWYNPVGVLRPVDVPVEQQRWPGHCYRTPLPLSEKYFLAAYSFDTLFGEPNANNANMFGLYLVDAFGNKELLYRDLNISSLWPQRLAARAKPPERPRPENPQQEGTFFLQNVYQSWPQLPKEPIRRLRIVQVLPKSTWHANQPMVGLAHASPGKQVLGTVPVEADGSACFRAPAGTAIAFQALDEHGQAVQTMRSVTYVQPGETATCVGCHEPRNTAPAVGSMPLALKREPSTIVPGPDGSKPLSYPLLVQPVLDRQCVSCHKPDKAEGGLVLTGEPQGAFSRSYLALATRVPYSDWAGRPGDFRVVNSEPLSVPEFFGSRGSPVMKLLRKGHYDVKLTADDNDRLTTWMDANALFYGTFDPADQARQRRGERIAGPKVQ